MIDVSKEEWADWVRQPSAESLRVEIALDINAARGDLLSRGLASTDPNVRAAAERVQTLSELLSRLNPKNA